MKFHKNKSFQNSYSWPKKFHVKLKFKSRFLAHVKIPFAEKKDILVCLEYKMNPSNQWNELNYLFPHDSLEFESFLLFFHFVSITEKSKVLLNPICNLSLF